MRSAHCVISEAGGWGIRPARSLSEYQAALRDERCGLSRLGTPLLWRVAD